MGTRRRIAPRRHWRLYLLEWREHRGLTQVEVAHKLGVEGMTVSRWERQAGSHRPTTDVLAALAEVYRIEPADFYHHPGEPTANFLLRDQPKDVRDQALRLIEALRKPN